MTKMTYDYSVAYQGVDHQKEFFLALHTDYVSEADVEDNTLAGKTVTILQGEDGPFDTEIRYVPDWYGENVDNYLPTSSRVYSIDFDTDFGFAIDVPVPEFPDINDTIANTYNTEQQLQAAFDAYYQKAENWYNTLDSSKISFAQFGTGSGVLGNFSSSQPIVPISFVGRIDAVFAYDTVLIGSKFGDHLYTYGGNDDLKGGKGVDTLDGGGGNDLLSGGQDDDTLTGGDGSDTFEGIGVLSTEIEQGQNTIDGTDYADKNTLDKVFYHHSAAAYTSIRFQLPGSGSDSFIAVVTSPVGRDTVKNFDQLVFPDTTVTEDKIAEKGVLAFAIWSLDAAFQSIRGYIGDADGFESGGGNKALARIIKWYEIAEKVVGTLSTAYAVDDLKAAVKIVVAKAASEATESIVSEAHDKIKDTVDSLPLPSSYKEEIQHKVDNATDDLRSVVRIASATVADAAYEAIAHGTAPDWSALWTTFMDDVTGRANQTYKNGDPAFYDPKDQFENPDIQPNSDQPPIILGPLGSNSVDGGPDGDILIGSTAGETFYSKAGNDFVFAAGGNDTIIAGSGEGDDFYDGGDGQDTIVFSSTTAGVVVDLGKGYARGSEIGADTLTYIEHAIGGSGADTLIGGLGNDDLDGGANPELGQPGAQGDIMLGGDGNDTYHVDSGLDLVDEDGYFPGYGNGGTDTIISTTDFYWDIASVGEIDIVSENVVDVNNDGVTIVGGVFDNTLIGHKGTDVLFGRGGNDTYRAGDGVDFISLSTLGVTDTANYTADGHNTIIVDPRSSGPFSYDIVFEFDPAKDKIDVSHYGGASNYTSGAQVLSHAVDDGAGNCYIALGDGLDYLYLVGLEKADLLATDFIV